jgi:hypothetical protein
MKQALILIFLQAMRINTPCWTQGRPRPRWEAMGFPRHPAQNPASNITQRTWTMDLRSLMSRPMPRQLCYLVCITLLPGMYNFVTWYE